MDLNIAMETAEDLRRIWPDSATVTLRDEIMRMRSVIAAYVGDVSDGDRFGALVELVPGLFSDDGQFGSADDEDDRPRTDLGSGWSAPARSEDELSHDELYPLESASGPWSSPDSTETH